MAESSGTSTFRSRTEALDKERQQLLVAGYSNAEIDQIIGRGVTKIAPTEGRVGGFEDEADRQQPAFNSALSRLRALTARTGTAAERLATGQALTTKFSFFDSFNAKRPKRMF